MWEFLWAPLGTLPVLLVIVVAQQSAAFLFTRSKTKLATVRYASIDGLRGYLAVFVFICHAAAWYFYIRADGVSTLSRLYTHFGKTSVCFFFMVTAFLFCRKMMTDTINWPAFYLSRLLRIYPVYAVATLLLVLIVGILTDFTLSPGETWLSVASQVRKWLTFYLKNMPDVNGLKDTWLITFGVNWTLRYEWLFYIAFPLVGLLFRKDCTGYGLLFSLVVTALLFTYRNYEVKYVLPFAGGILAAALYEKAVKIISVNTRLISAGLLILVLILVTQNPTGTLSLVISSIIFLGIASGNSIFGMLTSRKARMLGQLSYGFYLMHSFSLFILFKFLTGFQTASHFSSLQHWLCVLLLTPFIVGISFLLHVYVELPAIHAAPVLYERISQKVREIRNWAGQTYDREFS